MFKINKTEKSSITTMPHKVIIHNKKKYVSLAEYSWRDLENGTCEIKKNYSKYIFCDDEMIETDYPVKSFTIRDCGKIYYISEDKIFTNDYLIYSCKKGEKFMDILTLSSEGHLFILAEDGLYKFVLKSGVLIKIYDLDSPTSFDWIPGSFMIGHTDKITLISYDEEEWNQTEIIIPDVKDKDEIAKDIKKGWEEYDPDERYFEGYANLLYKNGNIYFIEQEDLYSPQVIYKYNTTSKTTCKVAETDNYIEGFCLDEEKVIFWDDKGFY